MKAFYTVLLFLLCLSANAQKAYKCVPSSATFIFNMNLEQLNKKSGDMNYLKYLKMITKSSNAYNYNWEGESPCNLISLNDLFSKPSEYGVNASENIIMYKTTVDQFSGNVFVITLSKPELFESKLVSECENRNSIEKRSTINGIFYLSDNTSIAINGNIAVVFNKEYNYYSNSEGVIPLSDANDSAFRVDKRADNFKVDSSYFENLNNGKISNYRQSTEDILMFSDSSIAYQANQRYVLKLREILENKYKSLLYLMESFVQEQADGVYGNRNFSKMISENHDASIFLNSSNLFAQTNLGLNQLLYSGGQFQMKSNTNNSNNSLSSGMNAIYAIDFLNGSATIKFSSTYNDMAYDYIKSIFKVKQNKKLLKYIDGKNLLGYMSVAINNKEMGRFYGDLYSEILNNFPKSGPNNYFDNIAPAMQLVYAFIDKEMLYNTIDGRAIIACTGFENMKVKFKTYTYDDDFNRKEITEERLEKQAKMLAVMSIGNYYNAKKLFDIVSKFTVFTKLRDNVIVVNPLRELPFNLYITLTEDALIITNDANAALNTSNFNNLNSIDKNNIMSHNMAFSIHTQEVMKNMKDFYSNGEDGGMFKFMESFGNLEMFDVKPTDNSYGATAVLRLNDASNNALYQILKTMKAMH